LVTRSTTNHPGDAPRLLSSSFGMSEPIPEPVVSPRLSLAEPTEARRLLVEELRQEADATATRSERAALLFDAGTLNELSLQQPSQAAQDYLAAYNADPRLTLALSSLLRIFERRISKKNLERLYEAEMRDARTPEEKAAALVDLACLELLQDGESESAAVRLARATDMGPAADAALLLEFVELRRNGPSAASVAGRRVDRSDDALERGTLLLETAALDERAGATAAALSKLQQAVQNAPRFEPFARALLGFAQRAGLDAEAASAAAAHADVLSQDLLREPDSSTVESESEAELLARATSLWFEVARLKAGVLDDAAGAIGALSQAIEVTPGDRLLHLARMLAFDRTGDTAHAADDARTLLALGAGASLGAAIHQRLAESALSSGDVGAAKSHLYECLALAPGSIAAEVMLDDLLTDRGMTGERIARLEARAQTTDQSRALPLLIEAARLAAVEQRDSERAGALFDRALALAPEDRSLQQVIYGAALVLGEDALALRVIDRILESEEDPEQRAALIHHRLDMPDGSSPAVRRLLDAELQRPVHSAALLPLARVRAASANERVALAAMHQSLASRRGSDLVGADAHGVAAARAFAKASDFEAAARALESLSPRGRAQRYVLGLFEEVLTRLGRKHEVAELLHTQAANEPGPVAADALLEAAARAELRGGSVAAREAYAAALSLDPASRTALWALVETHLGSEPTEALVELYRRIAEGAESVWEKAFYALLGEELHEHFDRATPLTDSAVALLSAPEAPDDALAFLLTSSQVDESVHSQACEQLEARLPAEERSVLTREVGGRAMAHGESQAVIYEAVDRMGCADGDDPWAVWTRTVVPLPHDEEGHVEALAALTRLSQSSDIARAAHAEMFWVRRLDGQGPIDADLPAPIGPESGVGMVSHVLAAAHPVRDNAALANAYEAAVELDLCEDALEALLGAARAHLAGGRLADAKRCIDSVLAADAIHLTALELALAHARAAEDFPRIAELTEQLGSLSVDSYGCALLEESALVRRSELGDSAGEERILKLVFARAPQRQSAYLLLHEFYAERGDTLALISLVERRIALLDDSHELIEARFELARLHRGRGQMAAALDTIDSILMLEEHVEALALAAEIYTTLERYADAVSALVSLAGAAGTPPSQRELARLGAADLLEHHLGDLPGALGQLEQLVADAPNNTQAWLLLAGIAERTGKVERAATALLSAREHADRPTARAHTLRAAKLYREHLGRPEEAARLLREALAVDATDLESTLALYAITGELAVLEGYEDAMLNGYLVQAPSATNLRELVQVAALGAHSDREWMALSALAALGHASSDERARLEAFQTQRMGQPLPQIALSASDLAGLRSPDLLGVYRELIGAVFENADAIDQLTASRYVVAKGERAAGRDAIEHRRMTESMARAVGVVLGDLYVGGDDLTRIAAMPEDGVLHLVFGLGVSAPLSALRRYRLALQIAGHACRTLPLLTRTGEQAERLVLSALVASDIALPEAMQREPLMSLPKTLAKVLPRRTRKVLPELYRALPDGGLAMRAQLALALHETRVLSLLLAPMLPAAVEELAATQPQSEHAAQALVRAWLSPAFQNLRAKLELSS
jgi:tetratricopeptide (TPR) repeat protein